MKPEVREIRRGEGRQSTRYGHVEEKEETLEHPEKGLKDGSHKAHRHTKSSIEVRGYMTLIEVAEKYNVPTEYLKEHLGIPKSASSEEKLGWLRKRYGFRMGDVKRMIDEYHKKMDP